MLMYIDYGYEIIVEELKLEPIMYRHVPQVSLVCHALIQERKQKNRKVNNGGGVTYKLDELQKITYRNIIKN